MKLKKRSGFYQSANVVFDPKTIHATSYNWWSFVAVIKGKTIFNSYRYSVTTAKHQSKVRQLMQELGIKIDLEIQTSKSLSVFRTLKEVKAANDLTVKVLKERQDSKRLARLERSKAKRLADKKARVEATIKRFADQGIDLLADGKELVDAYNLEQSNVIKLKGA